jgi:hypothetical protein
VDEIGINLDRDYFFGPFEQRLGQRALARANFDDQRRTLDGNRLGDPRQDGFAGKEVLPEPPPQGLTLYVDAARAEPETCLRRHRLAE